MDQVLIIFAKYPKPGLVKTRLAKDIGKQNAALIYKLLVDLILTRVRDRTFKSLIFLSQSLSAGLGMIKSFILKEEEI